MKFCERFHISPLDYARIPRKKIRLWEQMLDVEASIMEHRVRRQQGLRELMKK